MDKVFDIVGITLSLALASLIVFFLMETQMLGKDVIRTKNNEMSVAEQMQEEREFLAYDGKTVYAQDIVSAILEHRGNPYVQVVDGTNTYYWNNNSALKITTTPSTAYSSTDILTKLDLNKTYKTEIVRGGSGELLGIKCVKVG